MKIGMIVAIVQEIKQIMNDYGNTMTTIQKNGFTVYKTTIGDNELYVTQSGAGEIGAAACAQFLITAFDVEFIVNYGVVGALDPAFGLTESVVVKDVVHYDWDVSMIDNVPVGKYEEFESVHIPTTPKYVEMALKIDPTLRPVSCASADKFVGSAEWKKQLNQQFDCQICEMEAAAITITCKRNNVDCLLIKAVSDSAEGGAEEFTSMVERSAKNCMKVLMEIIHSL